MGIVELRERARFFMQQRSWGLALTCLDQVLEVPSDEDIPWIPDTESLLLRSRLRLITGNKRGAYEDAQFIAQRKDESGSRLSRALVLKAHAMFAAGDWEHALVIFHRVKRQTNGANKNAERGIQRCLEAINHSLDQIKQSQTPEITYPGKNETDKKYIRKSKRKQIVDTNVFMDDIRYLQELQGTLREQEEAQVCNPQKQFSKDINGLTQEAIDYINTI